MLADFTVELAEQFVDDEFREAAGVWEMVSKSSEDRQFYEARMKFLRDAEARLFAAREEGFAEGFAEGRAEVAAHRALVGKVQMLQAIIGDAVTNTPDLLQQSSDELSMLLSELRERFRSRGN